VRKRLKIIVSVFCVAALLLTLGLRAPQISLSDSHHRVANCRAAAINGCLCDAPGAITVAAGATLAAPAALTRLSIIPETPYLARPQDSFQHNRAPPVI
jgi:hypothetical protein